MAKAEHPEKVQLVAKRVGLSWNQHVAEKWIE
jgi:hypothetical protein